MAPERGQGFGIFPPKFYFVFCSARSRGRNGPPTRSGSKNDLLQFLSCSWFGGKFLRCLLEAFSLDLVADCNSGRRGIRIPWCALPAT